MFYLNICQIDKHDLMYNNSNNLQILSKVVSNSPDEVSSNCARIIRWNSLLVMSGLNWMVERDECGRPWRLLSKTFIRDDLSLLLLRSFSFLSKDRPVLLLGSSTLIHWDRPGCVGLKSSEIHVNKYCESYDTRWATYYDYGTIRLSLPNILNIFTVLFLTHLVN